MILVTKDEAEAMLAFAGIEDERILEFFKQTNMGWLTLTKPVYDTNEEGEDIVFNYCTFLKENGKCGIYPARPSICRDHNCSNCNGEFND